MARNTAKITRLPGDTTFEVMVVITRRFRFRIWIATLLLRLAVRVLGAHAEITTEFDL